MWQTGERERENCSNKHQIHYYLWNAVIIVPRRIFKVVRLQCVCCRFCLQASVGDDSSQRASAPCTGDRVAELFRCCSVLQTPHKFSQILLWRNWVLKACASNTLTLVVGACYTHIHHDKNEKEWKITRIILEHLSPPKCKVSEQSVVKFSEYLRI